LDVKDGRVVKGVNFVNLRDAGDPVENALTYDREGADELVFLDITASYEKRKTIIDVARRVAEVVFMPFTVGGGIGAIEDIRGLLTAGCDKVSINTAAVKNPQFVKKAAVKFGSQCIVAAIDAKRAMAPSPRRGEGWPACLPDACLPARQGQAGRSGRGEGKWQVYINGGRTPTGIDAVRWAKKVESLGAGEILLTSMDADGTKDGYDIELTRRISESVNIPVIASGGCGRLEDFYEVLTRGKADAALAASVFHYKELVIKQVKNYLAGRNIIIRT
jgi:cyclase